MPVYRYTVTEYDPNKPWVVVGMIPGLIVELPDEQDFPVWAASQWPAPRYEPRLEPEPLHPWEGAAG
jgi:hypothetical protein